MSALSRTVLGALARVYAIWQPQPLSAAFLSDLMRVHATLYGIIDLAEDQVLFVPLCGKCVNQIEAIGRPTEAADAKDVVVVV
jgi:hypothetical protein